MALNADVSSAIRDLLELTDYGKTVTLKQPNITEGPRGNPIAGDPTEHEIEALILPRDNLFSGTLGVDFESDRGTVQEKPLLCYVEDPLENSSGETVEIQVFDENQGQGSQIEFRGEVYNVTDEVYGNQVQAGFRSYVVRKSRPT